jgi:hypothetical protein
MKTHIPTTKCIRVISMAYVQENMGMGRSSSEHGDLDFDMDLPEGPTNGGDSHAGLQRQLLPTPKGLRLSRSQPAATDFMDVPPHMQHGGPLVGKQDCFIVYTWSVHRLAFSID